VDVVGGAARTRFLAPQRHLPGTPSTPVQVTWVPAIAGHTIDPTVDIPSPRLALIARCARAPASASMSVQDEVAVVQKAIEDRRPGPTGALSCENRAIDVKAGIAHGTPQAVPIAYPTTTPNNSSGQPMLFASSPAVTS
jgi:hypothetical protein